MLTFVFFAALFFEMYSEIFEEPAMMGSVPWNVCVFVPLL